MTRNVVLVVLAMIGLVGLSATQAQAGAGGLPFPIQSFFVCHGINADAPSPARRVDVSSSIFGVNPLNIKIGSGILACVVAKLFSAGTQDEIVPNPGPATQEGLKCYTFSASRQSRLPGTPGLPDTYTVTDQLAGVDPDVQVNQLAQYICAPANFSLNP